MVKEYTSPRPLKLYKVLGFAAAFGADIARREELGIAVGADFAHQAVALFA